MSKHPTLDVANTAAKRIPTGESRFRLEGFTSLKLATRLIQIVLTLAFACGMSPAALAVDGCTVLLCLAAPKWNAIPQWVPPIRQLFHDLARGRSYSTCKMNNGGGGGNSTTAASNTWAQAPALCPPQYTHFLDVDPGPVFSCDFTGAISVVVNGALFARTWWSGAGQSVTEFSPTAKAQLGTWDKQFDIDYAAWLAAQPPADPATGQ